MINATLLSLSALLLASFLIYTHSQSVTSIAIMKKRSKNLLRNNTNRLIYIANFYKIDCNLLNNFFFPQFKLLIEQIYVISITFGMQYALKTRYHLKNDEKFYLSPLTY